MSIEQREHDAHQPDAAARMAQHFEEMSEREDRKRWDVVLIVFVLMLEIAGFVAVMAWWAL